MTTRRDFLRKTTIALAGGLVVGDAAMELFERLPHVRKSFPAAQIGGAQYTYSYDIWERLANGYWAHRTEYPGLPGRWGSVVHHWDQPMPPVTIVGAEAYDTQPTKITVRNKVPAHALRIAYVEGE